VLTRRAVTLHRYQVGDFTALFATDTVGLLARPEVLSRVYRFFQQGRLRPAEPSFGLFTLPHHLAASVWYPPLSRSDRSRSIPPGQLLTVGWCSNAHVAALYVGQAPRSMQVLARRLRLDSGLVTDVTS